MRRGGVGLLPRPGGLGDVAGRRGGFGAYAYAAGATTGVAEGGCARGVEQQAASPGPTTATSDRRPPATRCPARVVWDNWNVHLDARLRAFTAAQDWVVSFQLPPYAPDLNPVEGIWSLARQAGQNNIAFTDPEHLMRVLRRTLREIQYRSDVIDGCLATTGLTLTTPSSKAQ